MNSKFNRTRERLLELMNLPYGWDHDDSPSPTIENLNLANELLSKFPENIEEPSVSIHPDTGVFGFYWYTDNYYSEAEFDENSKVVFYMNSRLKNHTRLYEPVDLQNLTRDWFYDKLPELFVKNTDMSTKN